MDDLSLPNEPAARVKLLDEIAETHPEVVRAVVEGLGVGGGHRSMAKGIIPLKAFRKVYGSATRKQIRTALHDAFVRAIRREDE